MTGLPPEVSVLLIALGLVLALGCYLVTNLSPGGMITPGWLALVLIVQPLLGLVIGVVVIATYMICLGLQQVVILYGKRLFATVVLVGVFFQITLFLFFVNTSALFFDVTTLGFIIPGLVAYQLMRQPAGATLMATATVTTIAYTVMLAGILLRLVPVEGQAAAGKIAAEPSAAFSSLQLALSAAAVFGVLAIIGIHARRVRSVDAPGLQRREWRIPRPAFERPAPHVPVVLEQEAAALVDERGRSDRRVTLPFELPSWPPRPLRARRASSAKRASKPKRSSRPRIGLESLVPRRVPRTSLSFRVPRRPREVLRTPLLSIVVLIALAGPVRAALSSEEPAPTKPRVLELTWLPVGWDSLEYLVLDARVMPAETPAVALHSRSSAPPPRPASRQSSAEHSKRRRASKPAPSKSRREQVPDLRVESPPLERPATEPVLLREPPAASPVPRVQSPGGSAKPAKSGGGGGSALDDSG